MQMPGESPKTWQMPVDSIELLEREKLLRQHVENLAIKIGERNSGDLFSLTQTINYIKEQLDSSLTVNQQHFGPELKYSNLEITIAGSSSSKRELVIGAHYDTAIGTRGANDNASGVALLIELAKDLSKKQFSNGIRLVFFANEEPPYFQTELMGSYQYASHARKANMDIICMLSLETLGFYSGEPDSQRYPSPLNLFYPDVGNFIAIVGNLESATMARRLVGYMREQNFAPVEGGAFPHFLPGISWSDHWAFWKAGYCGVMLTDTAPFRYPYYHTDQDLPDKLDYSKLALLSYNLPGLVSMIDSEN